MCTLIRSLCRLGRETVAACAAVGGVMAVTEIIEDEGAIAPVGVAEADHLAQLALFERGPTGEVLRANVQTFDGARVAHEDAARAPCRLIRDDAALGERRERTTQRRHVNPDALGRFVDITFPTATLIKLEAAEQTKEH